MWKEEERGAVSQQGGRCCRTRAADRKATPSFAPLQQDCGGLHHGLAVGGVGGVGGVLCCLKSSCTLQMERECGLPYTHRTARVVRRTVCRRSCVGLAPVGTLPLGTGNGAVKGQNQRMTARPTLYAATWRDEPNILVTYRAAGHVLNRAEGLSCIGGLFVYSPDPPTGPRRSRVLECRFRLCVFLRLFASCLRAARGLQRTKVLLGLYEPASGPKTMKRLSSLVCGLGLTWQGLRWRANSSTPASLLSYRFCLSLCLCLCLLSLSSWQLGPVHSWLEMRACASCYSSVP